jgi:hypothetical protein
LQSAFDAFMQEQSEFHYIFFTAVSRMIWAGDGRRGPSSELRAGVREGAQGRKTLTKQASGNSIPFL